MPTPTDMGFERLAWTTISRYSLEKRTPIDVEFLASSLGIEIKYEKFAEDLSGVLVKRPEKTVIGVNSAHAITRQRFTVAHELGHYLLKHRGDVFVDSTLHGNSVVVHRDGKSSLGTHAWEVHANRFAAALLMPQPLVQQHIEKLVARKSDVPMDSLVAELAKTFLVSRQAMEYRLTNLGNLTPG